MSVFSQVKTIILANLSDTMPSNLKRSVVDVLEGVDNDLDIANYIPSSNTEDLIEKFKEVLIGLDDVGNDDVAEVIEDDDDEPDALFTEEVNEDDDDDDDDIDWEGDENTDETDPPKE